MLFITSSLSCTRKLFKTTIRNVKSLFTRGTTYRRLRKASSFDPFSCVGCHGRLENSYSQTYREFDIFYFEFTNRWGNESDFTNNIVQVSSTSSKLEILHDGKMEETIDDDDDDENDDQKKNEGFADEDMFEKDGIERCLVVQKLMDIEMIEPNNLENVQDIKEVLHLYSRLTCPVYVDIFDKFVMDMHSDIFNFKAT